MEREMVEVKEPRMIKFERENQLVEGIFYGQKKVTIEGKPTVQYILSEGTGELITFLQTYDLGRKLNRQHVGHWVSVRYLGEDKTIATQGNALRKFKVMVSKGREIESTLEITDDDIPF